ncbi:Macrophage migration inhibitory factor, partial [Dillenia turbinata]
MPCLNISTNSRDLNNYAITQTELNIAAYVMIVLKGSVPMSFGGTEQPAAYGELVSIGGLNPDTNKKLSASISSILEKKLSVPKSRFFLKFYDTKASHLIFYMRINAKNMHNVCTHCTSTRSWLQLWMERLHLLISVSC